MKDCEHIKLTEATIKREFLGEVFTAQAQICLECGAELWDESLDAKYKVWIDSLSQKPKLQFKISKATEQCLERLMESFPSATQTSMIRSMIFVYLALLNRGAEVTALLEDALQSEYFEQLVRNSNKLIGAEVKPILYYDVASWSNLFEMKPNEFASDALHIMLALCISTDERLKKFWLNEILPELQNLLKVA